MLFKHAPDDRLLRAELVASSYYADEGSIMVYRPYDTEKKRLGPPEYMGRGEYESQRTVDLTTRQEAWKKAQLWLALALLMTVICSWMPLLALIVWLREGGGLAWDRVAWVSGVSLVIALIAWYRWWRKMRRWEIDL